MKLILFKEIDFLNAVKVLFQELKVPMNYVADEPTTAKEILKDTYKDNSTFALVDDVYFVGMVDDAAFEGNLSLSVEKIKSDYDGILIFGITLHQREHNLLPTRSQLAEISRAFNREFYYTPVVIVFKYSDDANEYIAFANTERLKYKQEWREGEKAGKVSLLRNINVEKPHRGHEDIIRQLKIPTSGKKQVVSFAKLYTYWQEVFSVSILNKKFYQELQNWYFWAIKEVTFPNQPNRFDYEADAKFDEAVKEHKAKNVIRLLTRILFIWFIKEKKLIPEELFDEQAITDKLIDDFTPQKPQGFFATGKHNSKYYRAILQNLFFATLNQEMGKREFRKDKQHKNVTNLMRYKSYFKDPDYFVQLMENVVPFMNGGLFECLDKPHPNKKGPKGGDIIISIDGFSDKPENPLVVPDYLFFDVDEDVDLSDDFGSKKPVYKNAKTRGLLEILKSYKFTITENTPIEEDVALDPELLGKVFENLLASYNPETKTTARKQTGSFYTPREIVNYMVDESLIAYLSTQLSSLKGGVPEGGGGLKNSLKGGVPEGGGGQETSFQSRKLNNLPYLKTFRKELRNNLTPAEAALWKVLKGKELAGRKFRRQHSVANYILDFYCPAEKLAIELDGQGHFEFAQEEYDRERDLFLKHVDIKVLRFENKIVWNDLEGLLDTVKAEFGWRERMEQEPPRPSDTPPCKGGEQLEEDLHRLFSYDEINPFEDKPEIKKQIIRAFDKIKILDPAAGSGAFPMGALQKMVHVLHKVDPNNTEWEQRQIDKVNAAIEQLEKIDDATFREQSIEELEGQKEDIKDAFENNELDYGRKLFLIENCIFGVDIQPIAVQIAKLRFFISLIVDQKIDKTKLNFGVRPLPNLETKFVAANTLIGIDKPDAQLSIFDKTEVEKLEKRLKKIRHKLFSFKSPKCKRELRKEDKNLREKIAVLLEEGGMENKTARQLASWDPYDQNASSPFFDPEWMFDVKEGFDVVIGNPPYMRIQGIREHNSDFADWLTKNYKSATGSFDLYANFTEKGINLCSNNGILNFIMPVKWTNAAFGKGLRQFLLSEKAVSRIISFDEFQVFNASTYTGIQFFQKNSSNLNYYQLSENLSSQRDLSEYLSRLSLNEFNNYDINSLDENGWTLTDNTTGKILSEINKHTNTVKDTFLKIFQGIATSKDSVYFLTHCIVNIDTIEGFSKELNKRVVVEKSIVKPLLKGDQVHKYDTLSTANYVVFPYKRVEEISRLLTEKELRTGYPLAYKYLKQNESILRGREKGRLLNDEFWYRYIYPKNQTLFDKQKLIAPDVSMGGNFAFDKEGLYYSTTTVYGYIKKSSIKESYYFYQAIFNSDLIWWFLKNTGTVLANGYFRFKPDYLNPFRLPRTDKWKLLDLLSRVLISQKNNNLNNSSDLVNRVSNALVFNLYFPAHMKERSIDVLEFVERDIASVWPKHPASAQKQDAFETLSDTEKETVIEQLHQKWTDPDNEVVKRMGMFKERSPDILKVIMES